MPKVSVNILTKDRAELLKKALGSIQGQSFKDFEVVTVDDGSADRTNEVLKSVDARFHTAIRQQASKGITFNRQAALDNSKGEYIAILDDDDQWLDPDKLKKQAEFLDSHPEYVLVGGGISIGGKPIQRPQSDAQIRFTMLLRNNFFTSTVMFRRETAIKAGGFIKDSIDLAEDYDLWLRLGKLGKMYNFEQAFTLYNKPNYNKEKFGMFLKKQLKLINGHKKDYPFYAISSAVLNFRLWFLKP